MSRGVLRLFATLMACITIAEIFSVLPARREIPSLEAASPPRHYLNGIVHVRSPAEPASADSYLAIAAKEAGLDFVVLADEDSLRSRELGWQTRLGATDFYVEMEAATRAGKVLVFSSHTNAASASAAELKHIAWQHFLGHTRIPGLFLVTSHPSDLKNPWVRLDRFPEGIELINIQSLARTALTDSPVEAATTTLFYFFNPFTAILRFLPANPKDILAWDAINSVSPGHFAIAASGIERKFPIQNPDLFHWPPHRLSFRLYSNAVFVETPSADFTERRKQTYEAIAEGRLALYSPAIGSFEGHDWKLKCGSTISSVGDSVALPTMGGCEFLIERPASFPYPLELRLWRDGEIETRIAKAPQRNRIRVTSPGAYRAEWVLSRRSALHLALDHDVTYVLYNPMYLR